MPTGVYERTFRTFRTWDEMVEILFSRVVEDPQSGCWLWQGCYVGRGYGGIWYDNQTLRVHRVSWIHHKGSIPQGICVLHKCDVRNCVNPNHLFLGTKADNIKDMCSKNRNAHLDGERNGSTHLTEAQVLAIYFDNRLQREIAKDYDITRSAISLIKLGKTWKKLKKYNNKN